MATLKDLSSQLRQLQKQIPFATAQAMTKVVRQIEAAQKTAFEQNLDNPTPFTVKSVGSVGARKNSLRAKVFVRDTAAGYLEPFEFGGAHKLNGGALLNPKDIKLNKYGNLPRNKLSQLKAKPNVFIGDVGGVNAVWQRKKPKTKKGKKRAKRSPNGTRRDKIKQPAPNCLFGLETRFQSNQRSAIWTGQTPWPTHCYPQRCTRRLLRRSARPDSPPGVLGPS
ncbi:Uncharacterised protein [Escherichia coli]|nr:Uncharacterised protein [Escherichia coli]